jgi:hypothetical protein
MSDFDITVDTDYIASWGALEIPVQGPASANTLVVLTGIAFFGLDIDGENLITDIQPPLRIDVHSGDGAGDDRPFYGQLLVRTGYMVTPPDRYKDVAGDGDLQRTAYVRLAHGDGDDTDVALIGVETADAYVDDRYAQTNSRPPGEVILAAQLAINGDCTLDAISYQIHLLLHKETPAPLDRHPVSHLGVTIG